MNTNLQSHSKPLLTLGCLLALAYAQAATGQALTDFGGSKWQTPSQWKTLVVLVDFLPTNTTLVVSNYHGLFFDPNHAPDGVNRYFREVSMGRFLLSTGAIIRIYQPASNNFAGFQARFSDPGLVEVNFHSNLVDAAMSSGLFDLPAATRPPPPES